MGLSGGEAEEQRQAGAATEQRVQAVAAQESGRMVGGGMAVGGVGVIPAPGFERGAVDDAVTRADDAAAQGFADGEHEEHLAGRGTRAGGALPLLGGAGHPGPTVGAGGQAAGEGQRRPGHQPVVHLGAVILTLALPGAVLVPYLFGAMGLYTLGHLLYSPTATAMAAASSPAEGLRARYVATYEFSWGIAAALVQTVFGVLYTVGPAWPWIVVAALTLAAGLGVLWLEPHLRPAAVRAYTDG